MYISPHKIIQQWKIMAMEVFSILENILFSIMENKIMAMEAFP